MRLLGVGSAIVAAMTLVAEAMPASIHIGQAALKKRAHEEIMERFHKREDVSSCSPSTPDYLTPEKANIWAQLTDEETNEVYAYLTDKYNLTVYENATHYDNFVMWIETIRPNKTDALAYLDGNATAPPRYAKAVMFFGNDDFADPEFPHGYWETYQIGPLPITNKTVCEPMDWLNAKNKVSFQVGYQDSTRNALYYSFVESVFMDPEVRPVIEDITKSPTYGLDNSTLEIWMTDPLYWDKETDVLGTWSAVFGTNDYDAGDILSHGLYFLCDISGRDASKYTITKWFYGTTLYNSTGEFVDAWKSGKMEILPQVLSNETDWTFPAYVSGARDLDEKQAPVAVEPDGRRWAYSESDRYFTWMDWEFFVAWDRDRGMALYDVKFKGERILYELGLQEAIAEYAGDDPFQMNTVFLDSAYGFGNEAWGLIPGYDCPYNAEYFNVSWHSFGENNYQNNSYCAYEFLEDYPISRHVAGSYVTVNKNPTFVLRTVTTIGNYDYNFAYKFFVDGTIDVSVRAAGYIQGSYYVNETSEPFGYKIGKTLAGSFHDHVLNFKADLDIGGTENQIREVSFVQDTQEFPWAPGTEYTVKKRVSELIETEDDSKITWPANGAGALLVESSNQTNKWGAPRAYRIVPGASPVHRLLNQSVSLVNQAQWANDDVAFTVQKDSEPFSSNLFNAHDIVDPAVKFNDFLDGESLVGADVVAWINLGLHHLPNTQDVPITIFNTAQSSFILTPYNFFDEAQIRDMKDQMFYSYSEDDESVSSWDFYGSEVKQCVYDIKALSYDMFNYEGMAIGKETTNIASP